MLDPSFTGKAAKKACERFRESSRLERKRIFDSVNALSIEDIYRMTEENMTKAKTCTRCGLIVNDYYKLAVHKDSENCRKRIAEKNGEVFVPKRDTKKHCEICNITLKYYNWTRHLESVAHLENVRVMTEPAFHCSICNKVFKGDRPKRKLKRHLCSARHMKTLIDKPWNQSKHDAMLLKHRLTLDTPDKILVV